MADTPYEVEITTVNAKGDRATVYAEYLTEATTAKDAAREVYDHSVKARGNDRVREVDDAR